MAEAELLITPDVARAELNRAVNQLEKAMAQAAKNAGKDFQDEISKGIKAGGKGGLDGMGGGRGGVSSNAIDGLKKAGGVLGGAAVMALGVGVAEIMNRVDIATSLIEQKMGESQAPETIAAAKDLGLSGAEYQAIREQFAKAGIREDADILETLREITVQTEEAERGEGELMEDFKGLRGMDLYRNVFESLGNVEDPAKRMAILAQLNEEQTAALSKIVQDGMGDREEVIQGGPTRSDKLAEFRERIAKLEGEGYDPDKIQALRAQADELEQSIQQQPGEPMNIEITGGVQRKPPEFFTVTEKSESAATAFQEEADKVDKFRADQYAQAQLENERFFNAFDAQAATAYFSRQDTVNQQQIALVGELSKNVEAANTIDNAITQALNPLVSNVGDMVVKLGELVGVLSTEGGAVDAINRAAESADDKIRDFLDIERAKRGGK